MDHASAPTRCFSYDLLKEITDGFSEERKLGSGGYGKVYKGVHIDGETIAVKLLYDMPALDDVQFKMEFNNLIGLRHLNIVRLVGFCHDTRQELVPYNGRLVVAYRIHRALCFEYAHNGSLQDNLSDEYSGHDWHTCYGIIKGICNGLEYLHQELKPPMYHLDLKPANVLLDENMLPKIADFGLSRLFGQDRTKITKSSLGTYGYLPPEYIEKSVVSNKFDIFSLGVVIIKVIAGPEGYSRCAEISSQEFVELVHGNWITRLQAPPICEPKSEAYYEQIKTCIELALRCVETDRHKRPTIRDIVDKINETETKIRLWSPLQALPKAQSFVSVSTTVVPSTAPFFFSRKLDHAGVPTRRFTYELLKQITDGFSEKRKLGSGGYGKVYKGVLKDGETIAVKILHDMAGLDDELLEMKFNNLMCLQHHNIVRLVGYCHDTRQECVESNGRLVVFDKIHRALCFEYVLNGNLNDILSDEYNGHDWPTRYGIIKGICNGLDYLHQRPPMYHLDLKPANVLLDENMLPKIADTGLSRLFGQQQTKIISSIGTSGYLPPEYIEKHILSNKFDIYSLGVIIIKVMAGPEGYNKCGVMSSQEFVELVHVNWKARLQVPPKCEPDPEPYYKQVKTCIEIALSCLETDRHKRPSITDILDKLIQTETMIRLWSPYPIVEIYSERDISPVEASRYLYGHNDSTGLRLFEYNELAAATDEFSNHSLLGEGAFGTVYKGSYTDENGEHEVAVKQINHSTGRAWQFLSQLEAINGTRHKNLVELKGWYCSQKRWNLIDFLGWFRQQRDKVFVVYELVPNGSLADHLHGREDILPWEKRYQIVKGVGSALRYLHHEWDRPILHRNIKPSNILLDYDFNAKLADFHLSWNLAFDRKDDVYSFGIVLLEIACTGKSRKQVWELYRRGAIDQMMEDAADPKLCGVFNRLEMERVIVLGLRCSHQDSNRRPFMLHAMKFLEEGIELPALAL